MKRALPLLAFFLLLQSPLFSQEKEETDTLVRLISASRARLVDVDGKSFRKAEGEVKFFHNNTYLYCDTAMWCVEEEFIDAVGNVRIIQEKAMLTGDSLHYIIPQNLALFRGSLVQLEDKDYNTLRTNDLDYNTKDSVAFFRSGASMKDKDGNIIESENGTFDSKINMFKFVDKVEMFSDSLFFISDTLIYYSDNQTAYFSHNTKGWKDKNYLQAGGGWYNRGNETLFFDKKVYILTDEYQAWCKSLFYDRVDEIINMKDDVQLLDTVNNVIVLGERLDYVNKPRKADVYQDPVLIMIQQTESSVDSSFITADTLRYHVEQMCEIDSFVVLAALERKELAKVDPVLNARDNMKSGGEQSGGSRGKGKPGGVGAMVGGLGNNPMVPKGEGNAGKEEAAVEKVAGENEDEHDHVEKKDKEQRKKDKEQKKKDKQEKRNKRKGGAEAVLDTLTVADTLAVADAFQIPDSPVVPDSPTLPDSLSVSDSLSVPDSLAAPVKDTTEIIFLEAYHNVKLYKSDIQMRCDSLLYSGIDSIARLFKDPILWREIRNQITADSMQMVMEGKELKKGLMQSNGFIISEEEPDKYYNQIKSPEMIAYFEEGVISRFDAIGGAQAIFYLEEDSVITTMNQKDTKIISARMKKGQLQKILYLDNIKSDAHPVWGLAKDVQRLKDFNWTPELRPVSRFDITGKSIRKSERDAIYKAEFFPIFTYSAKYFPGYIEGVLQEINSREPLIWKKTRYSPPKPKIDGFQDKPIIPVDNRRLRRDNQTTIQK